MRMLILIAIAATVLATALSVQAAAVHPDANMSNGGIAHRTSR